MKTIQPTAAGLTPRITPAEWGWVALVTAGVLVVTSVPYAYAFWSTPADRQFMGIMVNVPDHAQYFSWLQQYFTADLARNLQTPEPNPPVFFNLLWWLLAQLGSVMGWGYPVLFQVLRVVGTALALPAIYQISAWFLAERAQRQLAFSLAVFAAGLGWILVVLKYGLRLAEVPWPLLLFVVEPNTFFGILGTPHLTSALLYVVVFDLVLRAEAHGQLRYAVAAGLVALFLGWQHAYDLWLVYGILGGYGLLKWLRDRRLPLFLLQCGAVLAALSVWPALYSVWLTTQNSIWREVLKQFANAGVYTPNPLQLPILMGAGFLLALAVEVRANPFRLAGRGDRELFLRAWFWVNFLLIYLPTDYQIKMLTGWQIPISLLAAQGLTGWIWPRLQTLAARRRVAAPIARRLLALGVLVAVLPTNLYLWTWRFVDLGRHEYPYYLATEEVAALAWVAQNTPAESVILASLTIGQYVPALTGRTAFIAHWAQTVDFYGKSDMLTEFFAAETTASRRAGILQDHGVDYVFYGPAEQSLGSFRPAAWPALQPVYASPRVAIYQVLP